MINVAASDMDWHSDMAMRLLGDDDADRVLAAVEVLIEKGGLAAASARMLIVHPSSGGHIAILLSRDLSGDQISQYVRRCHAEALLRAKHGG